MTAIRRLTLRDFRSYAVLDRRFDGHSVVLTGPNGAGKTNLLEAISLLSPGRGLRSARLSDVRRQGGDGFGVGASLGTDGDPDETRLSIRSAPPHAERREARIDGQPVSGPGAFLDHVAMTWLTPAQDRLFVEGASERRRFLDRMTLTRDRAHAQASAAYDKAMRQRTAVLTDARAPDPRLLKVLEQQMAESGVAVAAARRETAAMLARGYAGLRERERDGAVFPGAEVALEGTLEEALATRAATDVEAEFAETLARVRRRDAEAGRALSGPHRADLHVRHAGKGQPARLCSTGEQKALLIGLVLAGAAARRAAEGPPLILLLDEVAAHLDQDRRQALADILEGLGCQAFMTGTDDGLFEAWAGRAQRFEVADGALAEL